MGDFDNNCVLRDSSLYLILQLSPQLLMHFIANPDDKTTPNVTLRDDPKTLIPSLQISYCVPIPTLCLLALRSASVTRRNLASHLRSTCLPNPIISPRDSTPRPRSRPPPGRAPSLSRHECSRWQYGHDEQQSRPRRACWLCDHDQPSLRPPARRRALRTTA